MKDKFYEKLSNILANNIGTDVKVIIGGDANSVWDDDDTSNEDKSTLDKAIRSFCEMHNLEDLMRNHRKTNNTENKHTWERLSSGLTKRIDSFWGKPELQDRVLGMYTLDEDWVSSDHNLIILDWDTEIILQNIPESETERITIVDNKKMGETLGKRDWDDYNGYVEAAIKNDTDLTILQNKLAKGENITETEIIKGLERINVLIDTNMRKIYAERSKIIKETEEKEKKKNEEADNMTNEEKSLIQSLNLNAFHNPNYQATDKTEQLRQKLPKGIDGTTAKLIRIKQRVLRFQKLIQRVILGKKSWTLKDTAWSEYLAELHPKLKISKYSDKMELGRVKQEARKISNGLSRIIYKRKDKYRRTEIKKSIKEFEDEGWKNSKKFFNKLLKKFKERYSIRKIPKKYLKAGQNDRDPMSIKNMVRDFWQDLYTSNGEITEHQYEQDHEWFKTEEWEEHQDKILNNTKFKELMCEIGRDEFEKTVRTLKNNKTGGPDGIINEQIKYGPKLLHELLRNIMNNIIKNKNIPKPWKEMRIATIYKREDKDDPYNYRGISLSSTLYKILAKIIAKRLTLLATNTNLIDEAQGVGKIGHASYNEARTLHNIIEDANQFNKELHLCYIDLTKAYDLIERWTLNKVLYNIGLPSDFIELMVDINTNIQATVETDFGQTEKFTISRGLRQGCPLSPLLFCLIIEPLIKWLKSGDEGYTFHSNPQISLSVLAYMDDLVIISKNREELNQLLSKLETFCNTYGMKISDKSVYTYKKDKKLDEHVEPIILQNITIKYKPKDKAYKYLGFWTTLSNTWEKQKKKAIKKHQSTLNVLGSPGIDSRLQIKAINVAVNTPLEYTFHSVPYSKKELIELEIKNKKVAKRMLKISVRCPTTLLYLRNKSGGMGIRGLWNLYTEINIADLLDVINFQDRSSLYYKTSIQRLIDLKINNNVDPTSPKGIEKPLYTKYWGARVIHLCKKENIKIENNKLHFYPINGSNIPTPNISEYINKLNVTKPHKTALNRLINTNNITNFNDIVTENKLMSLEELIQRHNIKSLHNYHWEYIRQVLCKDDTQDVNTDIITHIQKNSISDSEFRKVQALLDMKHSKKQRKTVNIYSDGSADKEKAGSGIWSEDVPGLKKSFRVLGEQTAYNGELQAAIFAVHNSIPNTDSNLYIDNSSVVKLGQKIQTYNIKDWKTNPDPPLSRLLLDVIEKKKENHNSLTKFIKIKGHSGVLGNEKADKRAKIGREKAETYLDKIDLIPFLNELSIYYKDKEVKSNYRKEIKKIHFSQIEASTKMDGNKLWNTLQNTDHKEAASNNFLRNKKIRKGVVITLLKARTDLLPHAKQMFERKFSNIPNPNCPWCENTVEDTEHIMLHCNRYEKQRNEIRNRIIELIKVKNGKNYNTETIEKTFPIWFSNEDRTTRTLNKFPEIKEFNKLAGILGYIPNGMEKVIHEFIQHKKEKGKEKQYRKMIANILKRMHKIVIEGVHEIWITRNKEWDKRASRKTDDETQAIDININKNIDSSTTINININTDIEANINTNTNMKANMNTTNKRTNKQENTRKRKNNTNVNTDKQNKRKKTNKKQSGDQENNVNGIDTQKQNNKKRKNREENNPHTSNTKEVQTRKIPRVNYLELHNTGKRKRIRNNSTDTEELERSGKRNKQHDTTNPGKNK